MTAFSFSAVAATDLITIAAHGLVTGDGPATALVGGPVGTLAGLSSSSDYWIIRVDANTIKLATSSANALAGTAVNITSDIAAGILGIGLPFRRARTYANGAQVKSADLNALQDEIAGAKMAPHWRWYLFDARGALQTNVAYDNGGGVYDGRVRATANTAVLKGFPLGPIPAGLRPTAAAMYAAGTGAAQTLTATLYKNVLGTGVTPLGTVSAGASPSGTLTLYYLDPLTTVAALVDGESLMLECAIGLSTSSIFAFGVRFDRP